MVCIMKEEKAKRIFENYPRSVFALTLGNTTGLDSLGITYAAADITPSEDIINAVLEGDLKAKKVISKAVKSLHTPAKAEHADVNIGMITYINMLTNKANRDRKAGPIVIVIIEDEENEKRNKFLVKYITALFSEFGICPVTKYDALKKIFKKRKGAAKNVTKYMKKHPKTNLSAKGVALKKINQAFFGIEMRHISSDKLGVSDIGSKITEAMIKELINTYSNLNLKTIDEMSNRDGKKNKKMANELCKKLAKKNKKAYKAYGELRDVLASIEGNPFDKMPKIEYGIDKKGKKTGGPKMNVKKFKKFFEKKKNRALLLIIFSHTTAVLNGVEVGDSFYNTAVSKTVKRAAGPEYSKAFVAAAKSYAKGGSEN